LRRLPVWLEVTAPTVATLPEQLDTDITVLPVSGSVIGSGTLLPPPPTYSPPQAMFVAIIPLFRMTSPQSPPPAVAVMLMKPA
jgi:hypothetical protein